MKKLLMSSVILFFFSISISVFQIACTDNVTAQQGNTTNPYVLPVATSTTLGGIKIGSGLNTTSDGLVSVPVATATNTGTIKIGSGLNVAADGTVSVVPTNTGNDGLKALNKILYVRNNWSNLNNFITEFWIMNTDGTGKQKLPIPFPTGHIFVGPRLSTDGKTVFFSGNNFKDSGQIDKVYLYSCSIDGTNFKVLDESIATDYVISFSDVR